MLYVCLLSLYKISQAWTLDTTLTKTKKYRLRFREINVLIIYIQEKNYLF
jgi:hypothetical protein